MSELSLWESPFTFPVDFSLRGIAASLSDGRILLSGSRFANGTMYREFLILNADGSISRPLTEVLNSPSPSSGSSLQTATLANGNFVACFSGNFSGTQKLYWYMYNSDGELINTKNIQGGAYVSELQDLSAIPNGNFALNYSGASAVGNNKQSYH